jgi:hypothetical protein
VESFIENIGAAAAPAIAGAIALSHSMGYSILWICVITWVLCFVFYLGAFFTIDKDIDGLRGQMAERAKAM